VLITIEPADPRPVFRQIVDEVQRCVAIGVLKPSDPLPAARTLATQLKINANTVQHAYRTLEREGTVAVRRGLGTFVTAVPKTRDSQVRQRTVARQIAEKMLREAYRQGLLASDLIHALQEIAPRRADGGASGARGQEKV
jgi:GntR family transcriptional regulator